MPRLHYKQKLSCCPAIQQMLSLLFRYQPVRESCSKDFIDLIFWVMTTEVVTMVETKLFVPEKSFYLPAPPPKVLMRKSSRVFGYASNLLRVLTKSLVCILDVNFMQKVLTFCTIYSLHSNKRLETIKFHNTHAQVLPPCPT